MVYNTSASWDKLSCTDYGGFGKGEDIFGRFSWSQNDSNCLVVRLKSFTKDDNKDVGLVQNLTREEADLK